MRIAIEGCAHGELDIIYDSILEVEKSTGTKIDLLICCGDFQSVRNDYDLQCMAVPDKYKQKRTFYKYYSGEKRAPVLTVFIGGNHEASNYLQELPYGGWVAPNIYYMGYANVITIGNLRIAGISGIYKAQHLACGRFELPPYNSSTVRSVYHIRNIDVFKLKQISGGIDIFLSHDWPCGVTKYGNEEELIRQKPHFRDDIDTDTLGSPPCMELLKHHHPSYWFSAHLHCKYVALIPNEKTGTLTKFLALDKCLPRRKFLQILDIPHDSNKPPLLSYDLEWLTVLYLTNHLLNVQSNKHDMPSSDAVGRWIYTPSELEKANVLNKFNGTLEIPLNFEKTAESFDSNPTTVYEPSFFINNQTTRFCQQLGIDDPLVLLNNIKHNRKNNQESLSPSSHIYYESSPITTRQSNQPFLDDSISSESLLNDDSVLSTLSETTSKIDDSTEEISDAISETPIIKKFKRRNYSNYENTT